MKMNLVCIALLLLAGGIAARPQDFETGMLLAAAQFKEMVESGAAARNDKSVEVFGQKMRGGMELGFGDAIRPIGGGRRRRRRSLRNLQTKQQLQLFLRQIKA